MIISTIPSVCIPIHDMQLGYQLESERSADAQGHHAGQEGEQLINMLPTVLCLYLDLVVLV